MYGSGNAHEDFARIILTARKALFFYSCMVQTNAISSSVQLSQVPCQGLSVKDEEKGNRQVAKLSNYMKTHEALWRLLATYPQNMPLTEAVRRARVDFTKGRKEVAL